ncbi:MAG: N-acetylglucosamine-6-phosphate deacetylase [Acidobacteria bacterium]|nr:N-acetylglucosamine-6-phosphate deacetylase [Acidobacteriota bacterium]
MTDTELSGANTVQRRLFLGTLVTDGQQIDDCALAIADQRIVYAGEASDFDADGFAADQVTRVDPGNLILPGLVDIHNHGAHGGDFPSGNEASARSAIEFLHQRGTTTLLASMVTAPPADLMTGIKLYVRLVHEGLLAGIHLEGPFLSHARCGAQNPHWLQEPDLELLQELVRAGEGQIATMTYAPELPGAAALVDLLTSHGITPSLGHTDSDDATAAASLSQAREGLAGVGFDGVAPRPTVTHLFNGMPPIHHRAPGPVMACLRAAKAGDAVVELIADNTHLDPRTVLSIFTLVGAANIALVTDSMAAAGLSDGKYMLGPSAVTVRGGVATLDTTGSIAGGTATLLDVVRRTAAAGISLADAVLCATAVPAAVLGLADELGSLRRGLRADVLVVTEELELVEVVRNGRSLA